MPVFALACLSVYVGSSERWWQRMDVCDWVRLGLSMCLWVSLPLSCAPPPTSMKVYIRVQVYLTLHVLIAMLSP